MTEKTIALPPGVNTQKTQAANAGAFSASNLIRWRDGLLERMAGWERLFDEQCDSFVRAIHAYQDLQNTNTLLLGTDAGTQIYTEESGLVETRLGRRQVFLSSPIYTAAAGDPTTTITDASHGAVLADFVRLPYGLYGDADNALFEAIATNRLWTCGIYVNGLYIIGGDPTTGASTDGLITSTDTTTWTGRALGGSGRLRQFATDGTIVIASTDTDGNYVYRSIDGGLTWGTVGTGLGLTTRAAAYGNSIWLVGSEPGTTTGRILRSTNGGASWSTLNVGPREHSLGAAHNGSYFLITYENNRIDRTTDGLSYSGVSHALPAGTWLYSVAWSPTLARWVVVGSSGRIEYGDSTATTWVQATSPTTSDLYRVVWTGKQFVACGVNVVLCSPDGISWFPMLPPALSQYAALAAGPDWTVLGGGAANSLARIRSTYAAVGAQTVQLPADLYTIGGPLTTNSYTVEAPASASSATTGGGWPRLYACNVLGLVPTTRVRVWAASHGRTVGQKFSPDIAVELPSNGIVLSPSTEYDIVAVPNTWSFDIEAGQVPGTVLVEATYENGSTTATAQLQYFSQVDTQPRNWFLDNFGEYGVFVPENGAVYIYTPPVPSNGLVMAEVIETGPQVNTGMFVAMPQAQILCFGSEATIGGGVQDPLLVRWCDAGDYTVWVATSTNQAGSYRLSRGSRIVGGIQAPQSALLWTDIDLWSVQYVGPPLVYGFQMIGSGCGLVSPKARCVQGRNTYWMGKRGFFVFGDNGVIPLPCAVRDVIFNDLDESQVNKIHAGSNSSTNEIMWFYPTQSGGTGEIDAYVKYNTVQQCWDYGRLCRTSWYDESVWGTAIGADANFRIQQHEMGYNDDGAPMAGAFAETGYSRLGEGEQVMFMRSLMPDMKFLGDGDGSVTVSVYTRVTPNGETNMVGPFAATDETTRLTVRARARLVALRIEWAPVLDYNARLGAPLADMAPSGRVP